jgi:hypothetical protein
MIIRFDLSKREDHECTTIAEARQYTAAKLILEDAELLRNKLRDQNEGQPRQSPEDLTEDWIFIQGAIAALNAVINSPAHALEMIRKGASR